MNLFLILSLSLLAQAAPIADIPDGIIEGRSDVKYGTYGSTVQISARLFQKRLDLLSNKTYGLARMAESASTAQAQAVFELEFELVRLQMDIANAPEAAMTPYEREALLFGAARAYADVRHHAERLFENMIRYIDVRLPGPNGQQIRTEVAKQYSVYDPNYRSDEDLSQAERDSLYAKKKAEFLAAGGSFEEVKTLNSDTMKSFGEYTRFEYVELPGGTIKITEGKAGHILLAKGGKVKSAGQMVVLKSKKGEIIGMIVSNASGSFKPDLLDARRLADRLQRSYKIPSGLMIVTKGEPLSTQAVKIYLKADGVEKALISAKEKELDALAKEIFSRSSSPTSIALVKCGSAFSSH